MTHFEIGSEFRCRGLDSRFAIPGSEPRYAPDMTFDADHIKIEGDLDLKGRSFKARCTTALRCVADGAREMAFDAVGFKDVSVRGFKHSYDGKQIKVSFPKPVRAGARVSVEISYRVQDPKLGMYFIRPDKGYPDKPLQVWTQGEDEYARYWFPCHDSPHDRTTTEVAVRVPKGFTAVSNGRLVRKSASGGKTLFHWKQDIPHATYLVTLAAGEFTELRDSWRGKPVTYYVPKGREEDARRAFGKTPKMLEFFSSKIGVPYAYPKYAQVAAVDFIYGGMENTSATTQTALTLHDERAHLDFSSDPLVAHELAHQWFGDLLTCRDWSHAWLNESFATYFEALFCEHDKGADEFHWELYNNAEAYFDEDKDHYRRPISTKTYKYPSDLFDRHLYEKGSLVLHMLRGQLGEEGFWRSINAYVADNKGKTVETGDLLAAIQKATGRNQSKFFDQWIFKAGHPEFKVRSWWDAGKKEAVVRVLQVQGTGPETGLFSLPVEFVFETAGGEKRFTETVEKKSHLFRFKLSSEPSLALFDPDHWLLKTADFPKPEAQWVRQLVRPGHMMNRVEAARALGRIGGPAAVAALEKALASESFWFVQGEIAQALGTIRTPASVDALLKAHRLVQNPKARRMIAGVLGEVRDERVRERLRATAREEKSYFAENASWRALARTGDGSASAALRENLRKPSWNGVLASGALEALAALRPADLIPLLKRYTAWGHPQGVRQTAVRLLSHAGAGQEDVRRHLIGMLEDRYLLVQMAVVRALMQTGDERAVPALKKITEGHRDSRLKRTAEEAVAKLKKGIEEEKK